VGRIARAEEEPMPGRRAKKRAKEIVAHLRETLTDDMAAEAYRCRYGKELPDDEYEEFIEELINEHYNAELDEWDEQFLYQD